MVPIFSLWLPILLSAVLVFIVSSIIHMVFTYHRSDFRRIPTEDDVMAALRGFNIPPGDYMMPHAGSMEGMKSEEYQSKRKAGPVMVGTFVAPGMTGMGKNLVQWFLYSVLVSALAAYVAGRAFGGGRPYMDVFCVVGVAAFMGYSLGQFQNSIWYQKNWGATLRNVFDGLVYALATAGVFGWLWPS